MTVRRAEHARFERVEVRRLALIERLRPLGDDMLNRPPANGGWSVAQVLSHVTSAESRSLGYIRRKLESPGDLRRAGLAEAVRSAVLAIALRSPFRFKAPPAAGEVPDRRELEELAGSWAETRAEWRSFLDGFPDDALGLAVFRHPVAGLMTIGGTLRFVDEHERHHERQIERILASHGTEAR